jgi:hypothetical protein
MKRPMRYLILAVISIIAGYVAFRLVPAPLPEISRADFLSEIHTGHVHEVIIKDQDTIIARSSVLGRFRTPYDKSADAKLAEQLRTQGVKVEYEESTPGMI